MGAGTELGRVRGLGAAKDGVHHWWLQRVTAIANIVLVLWFVFSLVRLPALDYSSVTLWLRQPVAAVPMLLLIVSVFWHFRLGVQVMLEDYLHGRSRVLAMLALNFYALAGAAAAVFAVLKIALGAV
ncbi:succinate dehydrogenase, hydrophobic membrane anchor protein [Polymorphobacter fuscus]|uniref:Succinate dehydrogenase hydrophobic membrane anchor subunit n=1 Tax=Sandarakinorhabdus fusca TaxID=1439888 RepID=A0A7C9GN04_9SPHN|nr:succinate dehydrogenase, hydrophobic membrane anchor protein [Polymorphobacter fuscus]KAB7648452.1 succinate dehydrogenase, hydrophobic membrane anchor protein [Polymorphobacter fuscus]MQT15973.1 succinate dehydrogenase, hydrophobic membrane anchor protein [Polymorphobacter fuscus]NJC07750.1 succinate dehydrogenase / fumarate reductase membrane anchor subunit [Polymorphobacter fuscus]